jgi:hypothetical protein
MTLRLKKEFTLKPWSAITAAPAAANGVKAKPPVAILPAVTPTTTPTVVAMSLYILIPFPISILKLPLNIASALFPSAACTV